MKRTKTMNLGKGNTQIAYAKVPARVAEFHKGNKNGKIDTSYELKDMQLIFRAVVTPNCDKPERTFTGTSFGKLANDKSLEKLETVAVGRALAFAGYLADGEIASAEEMERHEEQKVTDVSDEDLIAYTEKLESAKDLKELQTFWSNLPIEVKQKLDGVKEDMKAKLKTNENN